MGGGIIIKRYAYIIYNNRDGVTTYNFFRKTEQNVIQQKFQLLNYFFWLLPQILT